MDLFESEIAGGGEAFAGEPIAVIEQMAERLAEHHPATYEHCQRVSGLAQRLAVRLGVGQEDLRLIHRAGLLHDVGKLEIPGELLDKREQLSLREWTVLRKQVVGGARILVAAGLSDVAEVVRGSHERWDGLGYPGGLSGDAVPYFSRIIFVADAYDSMTGARTWADRLSPAEAAAELRLHSGTQFDPSLIEPMVALATGSPAGRRFRRASRPPVPGRSNRAAAPVAAPH